MNAPTPLDSTSTLNSNKTGPLTAKTRVRVHVDPAMIGHTYFTGILTGYSTERGYILDRRHGEGRVIERVTLAPGELYRVEHLAPTSGAKGVIGIYARSELEVIADAAEEAALVAEVATLLQGASGADGMTFTQQAEMVIARVDKARSR